MCRPHDDIIVNLADEDKDQCGSNHYSNKRADDMPAKLFEVIEKRHFSLVGVVFKQLPEHEFFLGCANLQEKACMVQVCTSAVTTCTLPVRFRAPQC